MHLIPVAMFRANITAFRQSRGPNAGPGGMAGGWGRLSRRGDEMRQPRLKER